MLPLLPGLEEVISVSTKLSKWDSYACRDRGQWRHPFVVNDGTTAERGRDSFRSKIQTLCGSLKSPTVLLLAAFLFLLNFNRFPHAVLYLHMTRELGHSEQVYGSALSYISFGSATACVAYGAICRYLTRRILFHGSIVSGIVSLVSYSALGTSMPVGVICFIAGFAYMISVLMQFDLTAQLCPADAAATLFASLMGLINLSDSLSTSLGAAFCTAPSRTAGCHTRSLISSSS